MQYHRTYFHLISEHKFNKIKYSKALTFADINQLSTFMQMIITQVNPAILTKVKPMCSSSHCLIDFYHLFFNCVHFFYPQSIILTFNLPSTVCICINLQLTFIPQAPRQKLKLTPKVKNVRFVNVTRARLGSSQK